MIEEKIDIILDYVLQKEKTIKSKNEYEYNDYVYNTNNKNEHYYKRATSPTHLKLMEKDYIRELEN